MLKIATLCTLVFSFGVINSGYGVVSRGSLDTLATPRRPMILGDMIWLEIPPALVLRLNNLQDGELARHGRFEQRLPEDVLRSIRSMRNVHLQICIRHAFALPYKEEVILFLRNEDNVNKKLRKWQGKWRMTQSEYARYLVHLAMQ